MIRYSFASLLLLTSVDSNAKAWCDMGNGSGYYADTCPPGAKAQSVQSDADRAREVAARAAEKAPWEPKVGMLKSDVKAVIEAKSCWDRDITHKWCGSHHVNRTRTPNGEREQWVFTNINDMPLWYLYFNNDILVSIQD